MFEFFSVFTFLFQIFVKIENEYEIIKWNQLPARVLKMKIKYGESFALKFCTSWALSSDFVCPIFTLEKKVAGKM